MNTNTVKTNDQKEDFENKLADILKDNSFLRNCYMVSFVDIIDSTHFIISQTDGSHLDIIGLMTKREYMAFKELEENWRN